ncbi:hypothetical protein [Almyronema epifaneia]|uniref:SPOR domain-containing protein n=1 Tax=Almyronema epifaneia S1 TaxID=2991925 RepID=A0ABW6IIP1_9CYAN
MTKYQSAIIMALLGLAGSGLSASADVADCRAAIGSAPLEGTNASRQGEVIVVGRLPERHYLVIVPTDNVAVLAQVQACVPGAFITRSRLGPYIQAGIFEQRFLAENLSSLLRDEGIRARVIYIR